MRSQLEKNREILCDEIEKLSGEKMTDGLAERLSAYHGAYKALCMIGKYVHEDAEPAAYAVNTGHEKHHEKAAAPRTVGGHLTREMATEWVNGMENEDGTTGPHWTMEKTNQIMAQRGIEGDPTAFFVALNATYSDLCKQFKKYNINSLDAYVDFARAFWLEDKDAVGDKLSAYYEYVVE